MSRLYRTQLLVLKRRPLGEADEIITCLSPDEGKFDAVAKGSRKARSSLVGLLEPTTHLHAQFARGKTLDPLTQARPLKTFPGLRSELDRLTHAGYLLELFSVCLPFKEPAPDPFRLLLQALTALEHDCDPGLLCRWVELHLLDQLGYGPDFSQCHHCQRPTREGWFSPSEGQITCPDCPPEARSTRISAKAVLSFYHLRRMQLPELQGRKPDPDLAGELERVLHAHLQHHWPTRPLRVLHL